MVEGGSARAVLTTAPEAARFRGGQPVRVRTIATPAIEAFTILTNATGTRLELDDPLPQPVFAAGVNVEVHPATVLHTSSAEQITAPGDRIVIPAPEGN